MYGAVPPEGSAVAIPSFPPKQLTLVAVIVELSKGGDVIVIDSLPEHPFISFTSTVYVPDDNPVIEEPV